MEGSYCFSGKLLLCPGIDSVFSCMWGMVSVRAMQIVGQVVPQAKGPSSSCRRNISLKFFNDGDQSIRSLSTMFIMVSEVAKPKSSKTRRQLHNIELCKLEHTYRHNSKTVYCNIIDISKIRMVK